MDSLPTSITGLLVIAVTALASVVAYLFRLYNKRVSITEKLLSEKDRKMSEERAAFAVERASWETHRETMRAELEEKLGAEASNYAEMILRERNDNRSHEDAMRSEFAELMEQVSNKQAERDNAVLAVMHKIYDRFVGHRRGGRT